MHYLVRRRSAFFWRFYALTREIGRSPVAFDDLLLRDDGAETVTSPVGFQQIRGFLAGCGFGEDEAEWPVEIVALAPGNTR